MCGRYYVDDDTAREIEKLLRQMNKKWKCESAKSINRITAKDIHPTQEAPILSVLDGRLCCRWQYWGFPGFQNRKVIFNARCESVMEKPTFRDSIQHRRIVIPATWFYEWNRRKEKNTFQRKDSILFMAGCYNRYEDGEHFVILTTAANASMQMVHDRMPLVLEREEIADWILNNEKIDEIIHKTPCLLERRTDYEQMSFFH